MDTARVAVPQLADMRTSALDMASRHLSLVIVVGVALVALLVAVSLVWRIIRTVRLLEAADEEADREGEESSARETGAHPLLNFSRFGWPSDPLNVSVVAHADQLVTAFSAAGWYRADRVRVLSSLRLSVATIFRLRYSSAPMSNLYLYGRKQDYAFQKPGRTVWVRDHVRFWDTGERAADGRPIWIGGATRDVAVRLSPKVGLITHKISPDVDSERATVMHDLTATGWVVEQRWVPGFGGPVKMVNAMGFTVQTDGRRIVLVLADVPVLLPLTTSLRGRLGSAASRAVASAFRWTLPRRGRRLARALEEAESTVSSKRPPAEA